MHVFGRIGGQKVWYILNSHIIIISLHWAKQVVIQVTRDVYGLVNHKVNHFAGLWVDVSYNIADHFVLSRSKGGIVASHGDWSLMVKYN
jgi:hypothetical protein